MTSEVEEMKEALGQFRLAVIEALSSIDAEIGALQEAVMEQKTVTPARLKQLRKASQKTLHQFRKQYSRDIPLAHQRL